jgi:hypothetical protein
MLSEAATCAVRISSALRTLGRMLAEEPDLRSDAVGGLSVIIEMLGERLENAAGGIMDAELRP